MVPNIPLDVNIFYIAISFKYFNRDYIPKAYKCNLRMYITNVYPIPLYQDIMTLSSVRHL